MHLKLKPNKKATLDRPFTFRLLPPASCRPAGSRHACKPPRAVVSTRSEQSTKSSIYKLCLAANPKKSRMLQSESHQMIYTIISVFGMQDGVHFEASSLPGPPRPTLESTTLVFPTVCCLSDAPITSTSRLMIPSNEILPEIAPQPQMLRMTPLCHCCANDVVSILDCAAVC